MESGWRPATPQAKITVYPVAGGTAVVVPNTEEGEAPVQFSPNGKALLVAREEIPTRVFMIDLATGQRKLFRSFTPADAAGLFASGAPDFPRDLKAYVYSYQRITSDLYVVDGLK
jgi:hypothetical protein